MSQKTKQKHGIIFDCDGTLVNSLGQALDSFKYALGTVGEGHRTIEEIKSHFGAGADRIFFNIIGESEKAQLAFENYLEHQSELAKTTQLHAGIRDLLDLLEQEQIPLAIVTGRHARDLEIVLKPHRLADRFITLVTDNHLPKSKPAPDGIFLAAEKMGILPANTLYVGDSAFDMTAAHAAGSIPVAALWDELAKPDEMAILKPALLAKTPMDVWTFFKTRFGFY